MDGDKGLKTAGDYADMLLPPLRLAPIIAHGSQPMTERRFRVYCGLILLSALGVVALLLFVLPAGDSWLSVALTAGCALVLYLAWRAMGKAWYRVQWSKRSLDSPFFDPAFRERSEKETRRLRPAIAAAAVGASLVFMVLGGLLHRVAEVTYLALCMLIVGGSWYLVVLRARRGR